MLLNFDFWLQTPSFVRVADDWRMVLFVASRELPRLLEEVLHRLRYAD
jgi:hypothetical protein